MLRNNLFKKVSSAALAMVFSCISVTSVCFASAPSPNRPAAKKQSSWMKVPSPSKDYEDAYDIATEPERNKNNEEDEVDWLKNNFYEEEEEEEYAENDGGSLEKNENNINDPQHKDGTNLNVQNNSSSLGERRLLSFSGKINWKDIVFGEEEEKEDK